MTAQSSSEAALDIFCDEAGFTGPKLLDPVQRVFSYAAVAISDSEAYKILSRARSSHPVQMPELKAAQLLKSARGTSLVSQVISDVEGQYSFVLNDKLLALCGKVFEYIYEPVFQWDPGLLYQKNLQRFVAMYCFIFFRGAEGEAAIRQFEAFMRTLDPAAAPILFDPEQLQRLDPEDPFSMIVKFAQGYRDIIVRDNLRMRQETPDAGKWALDVSISGLWSLLNHWGSTGRPLRVICDNSKPLKDQAAALVGGADDPGIQRVAALRGSAEGFGYTLASPIEFEDSRDHPGLQLADIIAGAAAYTLVQRPGPQFAEIQSMLMRHIHRDTVMPDFDYVKLGSREVDVNWLVLMELGERAVRGDDPAFGLVEFYRAAEATWEPGRLGDDDD